MSELPFSYTAGVFIDESILKTINEYNYNGAASPEGGDSYAPYQVNCPIPGAWARDPSCRPITTRFYNDILRTEEQTSFFGEVTFPVTDKLDFMVGMRKYDMDIDFRGQSKFGYRGSNVSNGRDYDAGVHGTEPLNMSDTITKVTVSFQQDEDTLNYFTRSEGYRPGGFNRGGLLPSRTAGYASPPLTYGTDDTVNTEFGVKTVLLDGSMRLNATYYDVDWSDIQTSRFDPVNICLLYTSPSPRDRQKSRMPSSA